MRPPVPCEGCQTLPPDPGPLAEQRGPVVLALRSKRQSSTVEWQGWRFAPGRKLNCRARAPREIPVAPDRLPLLGRTLTLTLMASLQWRGWQLYRASLVGYPSPLFQYVVAFSIYMHVLKALPVCCHFQYIHACTECNNVLKTTMYSKKLAMDLHCTACIICVHKWFLELVNYCVWMYNIYTQQYYHPPLIHHSPLVPHVHFLVLILLNHLSSGNAFPPLVKTKIHNCTWVVAFSSD